MTRCSPCQPARDCASCAADELPPGEAYEAVHLRTAGVPDARQPARFLQRPGAGCSFPLAKRRLNELQAARDRARAASARRAGRCATRSRCSTRTARCSTRRRRCGRRCWRATGGGCSSTCGRCGAQARLRRVRPRAAGEAGRSRARTSLPMSGASPARRSVAGVDAGWPAQLDAGRLAAKPFTPLPVLGIPGWWPGKRELFLL